MRRLIGAAVLGLLLVGSADALQWGVKVGGGVNFQPDPTRWGGHASIEIPLSEDYPTSLSAFYEIYRWDVDLVVVSGTASEMPIGLAVHYKAPLTRFGGTIYFAGGGGVLRQSGPDPAGGTASQTNGMVTVAGGTVFNLTTSVGIFSQFRWLKAFASGAENEYGIQVGLHFPLGRE